MGGQLRRRTSNNGIFFFFFDIAELILLGLVFLSRKPFYGTLEILNSVTLCNQYFTVRILYLTVTLLSILALVGQ